MSVRAPQIHEIKLASDWNVSVDCSNWLDEDELLTGSPSASGDASLQPSSVAINTSTLKINKRSVAPGKAIQFHVDPTEEGTFVIVVGGTTTSTPAQHPLGEIVLKVVP